MKILIDMNLSPAWVGYLQSQGIEAQHWSEIGQPNAADTVIFDWAIAHPTVFEKARLTYTSSISQAGLDLGLAYGFTLFLWAPHYLQKSQLLCPHYPRTTG